MTAMRGKSKAQSGVADYKGGELRAKEVANKCYNRIATPVIWGGAIFASFAGVAASFAVAAFIMDSIIVINMKIQAT